jgi:hypothetical protein
LLAAQTKGPFVSFLDRLLGRAPSTQTAPSPRPPRSSAHADPDAAAVERYRYLLRTAPPDDLERAHAEAFEQLTPEQRAIVRQDLQSAVPPGEAPRSDDPLDLARVATRAETRSPGTLERAFGSGQTPGMGGSFLQTFAAVFVATSMAQMLFSTWGDPMAGDPGMADAGAGAEGDPGTMDSGDAMLAGDFGTSGDFGDLGGFDI